MLLFFGVWRVDKISGDFFGGSVLKNKPVNSMNNASLPKFFYGTFFSRLSDVKQPFITRKFLVGNVRLSVC